MKKARQEKIREIIENFEVGTQEELAGHLSAMGIVATQATISRDIREMKLTKISAGNGKQKYMVLKNDTNNLLDKYVRVLREGFVSMEKAQNILVMKTASGMAMAVATAVDGLQMQGVVGSIAGDDTIMIAIRTAEDTDLVMEKIRNLL